jgi:hypothetical protein
MSAYLSADGYPVTAGARFWDNSLRVVGVTRVFTSSNAYPEDTVQTWHGTTGGQADTLSGGMRKWGRLARFFEGLDAEEYPPGTRFADVRR